MSGSAITESRSYTAETCRLGDLSFTRHLRQHNPTYDKVVTYFCAHMKEEQRAAGY